MLRERFPATCELLAERNCLQMAEDFEREAQELTDIDRLSVLTYFPIFLKKRGVQRDLVEFSYWEYANHWVRGVDLGAVKNAGINQVNPSAQFIELSEAGSLLGRSPGIYALWQDRQGFPREIQLNLLQARALDQLSEGMLVLDEELAPIMEELKNMDLIFGPKMSQGGQL